MGRHRLLGMGLALLFVALMVFTGCAKPGKGTSALGKDVAARVGDKVITLKEVDDRIARLPTYYQGMARERKKEIVEDMALEILLYKEAKKRGIQNDKEVKEMLEEAERRIMIAKFIKDEVEAKTAVSDKEAEEYYQTRRDEFSTPERWKASHILVNSEEEAKAVLDELSKGRPFEELAKEKSQDSSAKKGGDVGYFTKGQMVPEFEEAAFKLDVGQTSPIVKSQFGYHIIKLTDKKEAGVEELKDVSGRIKNELLSKKKRDAFDKLLLGLKAKTKIDIDEALLVAPEAKKAEPEKKESESTDEKRD